MLLLCLLMIWFLIKFPLSVFFFFFLLQEGRKVIIMMCFSSFAYGGKRECGEEEGMGGRGSSKGDNAGSKGDGDEWRDKLRGGDERMRRGRGGGGRERRFGGKIRIALSGGKYEV